MTNSIELQVISKILTSDNQVEVDRLCTYDPTYYSVFYEHIKFILDHKDRYGDVPDVFTFQAQFEDVTLVQVSESIEYLEEGIKKNKQQILLLETFNKLADLGSGDVTEAWKYLERRCEAASQLDPANATDIVKDAVKRSEQIIEFNKQKRIPTGFPEIDKIMYGGLSTVEELLILVARTNTGKSWVCTKMMESAQANGFRTLYYSPEMQSSFIGTRFDTWRGHFKNSDLFRGQYNDDYIAYLKDLEKEDTSAYIVEDCDMPGGVTTVKALEQRIKKLGIQLLIIDGLSYIQDGSNEKDTIKYKNICNDLFKLSKRYGCSVVVAMQANRETKDNKDDKGEPFPNIYNVEGSDHPARIATQVIALRQIFEKHMLDMRLEKSRSAKNTKPTFSYSWDPNTGTTELIADDAPEVGSPSVYTTPSVPVVSTKISSSAPSMDDIDDDEDLDEVEF